ncbi:6-O-methylguanine DNA methyltransferase [Trichoderma cornu-damae]|uniref:6-O-methylguanine DNA methyltransferase n=1 Tax=Trichoderma cornu-damae TaxID=654480 RepID=A0A9P8QNE3_9HYPO|nr:6-O-methylguanine DNA methyltransferase [Trichoderma cornu-damae]
MARSDEAQAFFHAVYSAAQQIPYGKVTTYAHIAYLVGTPQRPRQVGVCMKHLPHDEDAMFNSTNVPWQRVINSKGAVSQRSQPSGATNQAVALQEEGVEVTRNATGEYMVDLEMYGWFPEELAEE